MSDTAVIHPKFHHFNLKTTRLQEMIDFYADARRRRGDLPGRRSAPGCPTTTANHRIALLAFPNFVDDPEKDTPHRACTTPRSSTRASRSSTRATCGSRRRGSTPALCLDHGMTFSYYYADPDGNHVELQVDNFGDWAKSKEWMRTLRGVHGQPDRQFVDPERVAADHADGVSFDEIHAKAMAGGYAPEQAAGRDPGGVVMRLCRFDAGAGPRHGVVERRLRRRPRRPAERHPLDEVRLLAPVRPAQVPGDRPQLRRPHRRERAWRRREFPVFFNKQSTCVVGPGRRRPHAARLEPARLRGRAGDRDRHPLPPRARGPRARGDRRLHDRQRRLGARLAAAHADDDDGQVVRHARAARAVARHRRRARRPARPRDPDLRQRRAAPGRQHRAR